MINVTTGAEIKMDESEEYADMCQAIRDIREEEGKKEGKREEMKGSREKKKILFFGC